MERIQILADTDGERLDAFVASRVKELTRSACARLIETGHIRADGAIVKKNHRVTSGQTLLVTLPAPLPPKPSAEDIGLDIVFEDEDVIVVNKPRGMVVHPAPGHPDGTLVNALIHHCGSSLSGVGGEKRPGIVHRIDKDTSGLIIVAKNDFSHLHLSKQLSDHSLSRVYEAVARGSFREFSGTVDAPIGRHPSQRKRMAVTTKGTHRRAVTHWELLAQYAAFAHIRCKLETGRTHQIRVHMAHIGHPLVGDPVYGGAKKPEKGMTELGQCLHARELCFTHPRSGEPLRLITPLPDYFTALLAGLGPSMN